MSISRRDFISMGGKGLIGGIIAYGAIPSLLRKPAGAYAVSRTDGRANIELKAAHEEADPSHYWRFIVDITKCIGCGRCVKACKLENDVPLEPEWNRTWVERYVITETGETYVDSPEAGLEGFAAAPMNAKYDNLEIRKSFFVPKLCNHCDKPPCVRVCPVQATYINERGVVLVNRKACIGCRYCIQACPFGARFLDPRHKVVDKCTWCYHRITKGLRPACVEVCPAGARIFGDVRDHDSAVSKIIKEETLGMLKPDLGVVNKVYYVGLEKGVQ